MRFRVTKIRAGAFLAVATTVALAAGAFAFMLAPGSGTVTFSGTVVLPTAGITLVATPVFSDPPNFDPGDTVTVSFTAQDTLSDPTLLSTINFAGWSTGVSACDSSTPDVTGSFTAPSISPGLTLEPGASAVEVDEPLVITFVDLESEQSDLNLKTEEGRRG